MSPGPIATNSAIFVGYRVEGVAGAIVSAAGMVLPSLFIILAVGFCFYRVRDSKTVQAALYGLRPVITGLIVYAAVVFAFHNELAGPSLNWHTFSLMSVFAVSLFVLLRLKWHPALVILLSGAAGVILYS